MRSETKYALATKHVRIDVRNWHSRASKYANRSRNSHTNFTSATANEQTFKMKINWLAKFVNQTLGHECPRAIRPKYGQGVPRTFKPNAAPNGDPHLFNGCARLLARPLPPSSPRTFCRDARGRLAARFRFTWSARPLLGRYRLHDRAAHRCAFECRMNRLERLCDQRSNRRSVDILRICERNAANLMSAAFQEVLGIHQDGALQKEQRDPARIRGQRKQRF